jgi:hypothetical protein
LSMRHFSNRWWAGWRATRCHHSTTRQDFTSSLERPWRREQEHQHLAVNKQQHPLILAVLADKQSPLKEVVVALWTQREQTRVVFPRTSRSNFFKTLRTPEVFVALPLTWNISVIPRRMCTAYRPGSDQRRQVRNKVNHSRLLNPWSSAESWEFGVLIMFDSPLYPLSPMIHLPAGILPLSSSQNVVMSCFPAGLGPLSQTRERSHRQTNQAHIQDQLD